MTGITGEEIRNLTTISQTKNDLRTNTEVAETSLMIEGDGTQKDLSLVLIQLKEDVNNRPLKKQNQ